MALDLLGRGHRLTVFNRGQTPDELPAEVERLHGDRGQADQLKRALSGRSFDAVVDMALYNGADAQAVIEILNGRTGHYVFISSGQVYLVRQIVVRPSREEDYDGPLMPAPPLDTRDHEDWAYGIGKRQAEDALMQAWADRRFPYTTLRLPMVNSERDHFHRVYNYLLRMNDGGPVLLPAGVHLSLRHVYGADVVRAMGILLETGNGKGHAYNISQEETVTIQQFLETLGGLAGYELRLAMVERAILESHHLIPACSPFSDPWMSEPDNRRSKAELGITYTPLPEYLRRLVSHYQAHPPSTAAWYSRRQDELRLAREMEQNVRRRTKRSI